MCRLVGSVLASGRPGGAALGPVQTVPADATRQRYSFCGKRRHQVTGLATTVINPSAKLDGDAAICTECLTLCREINAEQLP